MKSTIQSGLWKVEFGELGATLKVLQDHGVTPDHLARLRAEPDYAKRVAEFMLRGGLDASIHQKLARAVMGKDFFGVEDWSALYGVNFSQKQLRQVAEFPWGEDILNSTCPLCGKVVKDCHFAFVGLDRINGKPLTILKLQELHPATGQPKFHSYTSAWYSEQKFARETTMSFRWYLLHQNIVPKSEDKTYDDQKAMLTADYEVPSAVTESTKDLLVFRKTGNFVNSSRYARCECVASVGRRVDVGYFGESGLVVYSYWGGGHRCGIGLAASRKFPAAQRS
ncbi:hypothetical protein A3G55_02855 [Candidatus Giovannonibacteria bacterium RIFCSPLOWO2_12_FULL_44_25]|uniref:Uncharacterized protein n=3 Tax=Candidatus Giovannoniibacteriota TaxID=1752738 RepID=A0A0G1ICL6_9BACT|nr:MAG: hypothetical protein UW15_C0033G0015 [Parcubacteria group bacterium GW2011_GWC1_44_10]KKT57091.1 MAG: hypothetical protein UW49_C0008G0053 [Candidatus Giovannonibacteria bacterium GW2011_GWB1_44_23]KKT59528.1 MAG: hypothetical protein UW53_C0011G0057 [Candidatus Giovannonibacteria bacterium GW2011_GWA1_44_25]OGF49975.1 MAG: hypothetical protein A2120_04680 [Candidatus Giovannonibacteria bacterium GWA2_45_15]OGF60609.1 MAG: hypothetical protein A2656_00840 [Candidatus Giovannonibacteria 